MQNLFAYNNEGDNPQGASKFDPTFPLLHFCLSRFAMGDNAILAKLWSGCNTKRQERGEICSQQQAESKWTNPQERKEKIGLLPWEEVYAAVLNSDTVAPPDTRGGHTEILSHLGQSCHTCTQKQICMHVRCIITTIIIQSGFIVGEIYCWLLWITHCMYHLR